MFQTFFPAIIEKKKETKTLGVWCNGSQAIYFTYVSLPFFPPPPILNPLSTDMKEFFILFEKWVFCFVIWLRFRSDRLTKSCVIEIWLYRLFMLYRHCTRSVWTCWWWSFHLYIVSRLLWSRFNKMKTKFTPENLALNVCCMVDICFRSSMATPSLNMSGHQMTIGKRCSLTSFLILHHLNQRTIRSRWVIEIRSKEGIVLTWVLFLKFISVHSL